MKIFTKTLLLTATVVLLMPCLQAQNKITLSHQGVPSFFSNSDVTLAIAAAQNGDTLYLPGGNIYPNTVTVNKALHIIGTGTYPDSVVATQGTNLTTWYFVTGADGGSIQGCTIGTLQIGTNASDQSLNGLSISRCSISNLNLGAATEKNIYNISVSDNVIALFRAPGTYNASCVRNIFYAGNEEPNGYGGAILFDWACDSVYFANNIFYGHSVHYWYIPTVLAGAVHCLFQNNIIINNTTTGLNIKLSATYSVFENTLICGNNDYSANIADWGSNVQTNTISQQLSNLTFVNATSENFSYGNNYHLNATSPGNMFGTDTTDVGIYGTLNPYKDGAVPSNPHIVSKSISTSPPNGILNVNIKVTSQNR